MSPNMGIVYTLMLIAVIVTMGLGFLLDWVKKIKEDVSDIEQHLREIVAVINRD